MHNCKNHSKTAYHRLHSVQKLHTVICTSTSSSTILYSAMCHCIPSPKTASASDSVLLLTLRALQITILLTRNYQQVTLISILFLSQHIKHSCRAEELTC